MAGPVLVVDDDPKFLQKVTAVLSQRGRECVAVETGAEAVEAVGRAAFDVVVVNVALAGGAKLKLLDRLREKDSGQEIILVTDDQDVDPSDLTLSANVADCLTKPVNEAALRLAVDRAVERATLRRERARLLDENAEFVRNESITNRCFQLLSNPDLEWVQERLLSDLTALCDAQSAAVWVMDERGAMTLRAYRGLLDKQYLQERLDLSSGLGAKLREGAPFLGNEKAPTLSVPLLAAGELMGMVQLSDPLGGSWRSEHQRTARTLADFAAMGVKNGRKFLALQRMGLRDRDTAAYNLSYFTDYALKEIYKARRYGRSFSLLTLAVDNLVPLRARFGAEDAKKATRGVIRALSKIVRDSDVIAKASDHEFYVLLPETDFFGAVMFVRRAMAAVSEEPEVQEVEQRLPLAVIAGASTFPKDGEDFDELVHRCRERMEERRTSLQRKLHLEGLGFWEQVELLLGSPDSAKLPTDEKAAPARRGKVSDSLFSELQAEIARELHRDPGARGILYVGGPEVSSELPIASGLEEPPEELASRVYVLGRRADIETHPGLMPVFLEGDDRMNRHQFIFWLAENAAYALVQRRGKGATWGFHTSDAAVVDGLITKLQAEYDLQPY